MLELTRLLFGSLLALSFTTQVVIAAEPVLLSDSAKVMDQDRALVFVHGLRGNPNDSFGNWPQIIAADQTDLPDFTADPPH